MLSRFSVSITYPLLFLTLVVGVGLLFGGLGLTGTERTSRDLLERLTDQATERVRLAVRTNLERPKVLSELNADLLRVGAWETDDLTELVPSLWTELMSYPAISAILVSNSDLDTLWVERRMDGREVAAIFESGGDDPHCIEYPIDEQGELVLEPIGSYPYSPSGRPWYRAAVGSETGAAWTPLYSWATSDSGSTPVGAGYSVHVTDDAGRTIGVTDVGFTVDAISDYLSGIRVSANGRLFVMDADGFLVAGDSPEVPCTIDGELVRARDSGCVEVAHAAAVLADPDLLHIDDAGFTHSAFTEHDGNTYLVDATSLGVSWAPDWTIVTVVPESDLLVRVREMQQRLLYWGIGVLAAAALAGILLAYSIVRPIVGLQRTAARITGGDLDASFPGGGGREFSQLAGELDAMTSGLRERLELRASLEVAMEVQQHLLPGDVPQPPALEVAAFSTYCDETGGDYYDFPEMHEIDAEADGSLLVAIGDVTGHGIGSALIMATARAALRTRLRHPGSIGEVLTDVNEILVGDTPVGKFMTFLAMQLSPDGSSFRWASAGHDPPLVYDSARDGFAEPEGGGVPLGILEEQVYEEYECPVGPAGSIVLTGTDGIWETASPEGELFGKDRLRTIIRERSSESPRKIGEAIIAELDRFRGSDRPLDDVTMVVVKRT